MAIGALSDRHATRPIIRAHGVLETAITLLIKPPGIVHSPSIVRPPATAAQLRRSPRRGHHRGHRRRRRLAAVDIAGEAFVRATHLRNAEHAATALWRASTCTLALTIRITWGQGQPRPLAELARLGTARGWADQEAELGAAIEGIDSESSLPSLHHGALRPSPAEPLDGSVAAHGLADGSS